MRGRYFNIVEGNFNRKNYKDKNLGFKINKKQR